MKLFNFLKTNLLGTVESDFFTKNRELLEETNYAMLQKACLFAFCMCCFLLALTFFHGLLTTLHYFYSFFAIFFGIETLIVFSYVKKHKNLTTLFFYIFAIAILVLAGDIGTLKSYNTYAVTFYVFLIIIPMLHVGKPIYAVILSVVSCICFCFIANFVKSATPQIASNDILNAVCCCIVGIGLNITFINLQLENLQAKVHLEHLSRIDELTSLPNRRSLNLYINNIFQRKNQYNNISIIMIDIDNFKGYNDLFGHLEGDECLRQVGKILHAAAKNHSLFVARFGGEEFVAISTSHEISQLAAICDAILLNVKSLNIKHPASPLSKVTISIGYADLLSTNAQSYMELINYADFALYISKTNGKNQATKYEKSYTPDPVIN